MLRLLWLVAILVCLLNGAAGAVQCCDVANIAAAVRAATAGDTIVVPEGTYTGCNASSTIFLPSSFDDPASTGTLTLVAANNNVVIDCTTPMGTPNTGRVIDFRPSIVRENDPAQISDLASDLNKLLVFGVSNNYKYYVSGHPVFESQSSGIYRGVGGLIQLEGFTFTNHVYDNTDPAYDIEATDDTAIRYAQAGGAVAYTSAFTRFTNCTFTNNYIRVDTAVWSGDRNDWDVFVGGLIRAPANAELELIGCVFTANTASVGGYTGCDRCAVPNTLNPRPYGALVVAPLTARFLMKRNVVTQNKGAALVAVSRCPSPGKIAGDVALTSEFAGLDVLYVDNNVDKVVDAAPCNPSQVQQQSLISDCTFDSNIGVNVFASALKLDIEGTTFTNNKAFDSRCDSATGVCANDGSNTFSTPVSYAWGVVTLTNVTYLYGLARRNVAVVAPPTNIRDSLFTNNDVARVIELRTSASITRVATTSNRLTSTNDQFSAGSIHCAGWITRQPTIILQDVTIANETMNGTDVTNADFSGVGGLAISTCTVTGKNVIISGVNATGLGGGVYCSGAGGSLQLADSTISGCVGSANDLTVDSTQAMCGDCGCCKSTAYVRANLAGITIQPDTCSNVQGVPCEYTCNNASLVPKPDPPVVTCLSATQFRPATGLCTLPKCVALNITNGRTSPSGNVDSGTPITIECETGFALSDATLRNMTCVTNLTYIGTAPTCEAALCPDLAAPTNGQVTVSSRSYLGQATYTCDINYERAFDGEATCQVADSVAVWSPAIPAVVCQAATCPLNTTVYGGSCADTPANAVTGESCVLGCAAGTIGPVATTTCVQTSPNGPGALTSPLPSCSACPKDTFAEAAQIACTVCPNGKTIGPGTPAQSECLCNPGYYEDVPGAGHCIKCPTGGNCVGNKEQPVAAAGYSLVNGAFVACRPATACAGGDTCAPGYTGFLCGQCADGYFHQDLECKPCPHQSSWQSGLGIAAIAVLSLGMVLFVPPSDHHAIRMNMATPSIFISFAQVLSEFSAIPFHWGIDLNLNGMFNFFSFFNINFDLTNIECVVKYDYFDKLSSQLLLPVIVLAFFIVVAGLLSLLQFIKLRKRGGAGSAVQKIVMRFSAGYLLFMTLAYMFLSRASVGFFSCFEEGGHYTLSLAPGVFCYTDTWYRYLPAAIAGVVVYVIGIPASMLITYGIVRSRYGRLAAVTHPLTAFYVTKYNEQRWFWELLVMLRKLLIVFFTLYFIQSSLAQAVSNSIVLLVAVMITLSLQPFLWTKHDKIESASLLGCLLVLFGGIIVNSDGMTETQRNGVSVFIVVVVAIIMVVVTVATAIETYVRVLNLIKARSRKSALKTTFGFKDGKGATTGPIVSGADVIVGCVAGQLAVFKSVEKPAKKEETAKHGSDNGGDEDKDKQKKQKQTPPDHVIEAGGREGAQVAAAAWLDASRGLVIFATEHTLRVFDASNANATPLMVHDTPHRVTCLAVRDGVVVAGDESGLVSVYTTDVHDSLPVKRKKVRVRKRVPVTKAAANKPDSSLSSSMSEQNSSSESESVSISTTSAKSKPSSKNLVALNLRKEFRVAEAPVAALLTTDKFVYAASGHVLYEVFRETGRTSATWEIHHKDVLSLELSGSLLISGGRDNEAIALDITTGVVVVTFSGHPDAVTALAAHGDYLFTGCGDGSIRLWSLEDGRLLQLHKSHARSITGLHVADWASEEVPAGALLHSSSADGAVKRWEIDYSLNMVSKSNEVDKVIASGVGRICGGRCSKAREQSDSRAELAKLVGTVSSTNDSSDSDVALPAYLKPSVALPIEAQLQFAVAPALLSNLPRAEKEKIHKMVRNA